MSLKDFGIDQDVINRLRGLDLSGHVHDLKKIGGRGTFSDVSKGLMGLPHSQNMKKVAIKHMRFHLEEDIKKVNTFASQISLYALLIACLAFREGNLRLVKARPSERSSSPWLLL